MVGRSLWILLCLVSLISTGLVSNRVAHRYPEDNELTLLSSINVGGGADALVIDSCRKPGEVIFFNRTAGDLSYPAHQIGLLRGAQRWGAVEMDDAHRQLAGVRAS